MAAIQYFDYGDPDVLEPVMAKTPSASPGHPLIRVHATSVNPIDYRIRKGEIRWLMPGGFPRIPGFDVAGVIADCEPESRWKIGDRVMAFLDNRFGGAYAEYATCDADCIAKIPDLMTFNEAASMPLAGTTALQSLRDHADLKAGDRVLINGASGGVGIFAVQIAKAMGAHVTAVASGAHKDFLKSLGADEFIDYQNTKFAESSQRWNIVFDVAGKSSYQQSVAVLSDHGHFVSTEPSLSGLVMSVMTRLLPKQGRVMLAKPRGDDLAILCEKYQLGKLRTVFDSVMKLDDAAKAHRKIQTGVEHGKIVLEVG